MFYVVRATLAFTEEDEARDFYHDCQLALAKSSVINADLPTQEGGYISLEECIHDQDPQGPCKVIAHNEVP